MDPRAVRALVARVRRRIRFQHTLEGASRLGLCGAALFLAALLLVKLHRLPARALLPAGLGALGFLLVGAVLGALRRVRDEAAAHRADAGLALRDRLVSALDFLRQGAADPFMQAQIRDAARHAAGADARRAAPLAAPAQGRTLALLCGAVGLLALVPFPAPRGGARRWPQAALRTPAEIGPARDVLREMREAAQALKDPELDKLASEVEALLRKLETGEITRKEFFEKLAELEQKMHGLSPGDFEAAKEKLRQAGEALAKEKPTREAGRALEKDDLDKAAQELQKLAEALKNDKADPAARREAARALADAASRQRRLMDEEQKRENARDKSLADQKRELDKLARENNDKPEAEKRRLEEQKRELDKLARERQAERDRKRENQRQLQRLSRNLQDAAQKMSSGQNQSASQSLDQAAGEMSRMAEQMQRAGQMQKVKVQLAELKEALRRNGQPKDGKGQQGQQGQPGQQGKMGEFLARAGGQKGQGQGKDGQQLFVEGEGQPGEPKLLLPGQQGKGSMQLEMEGQGQGQSQGPAPPRAQPGDGIGSEHDPNLAGERTKLAAKTRDVSVEGREGQGPTRSEVIYGAADKGFATRTYRRVYTDYKQVVEEVMDREQIPLGTRYYIKRYFNLIKPRE